MLRSLAAVGSSFAPPIGKASPCSMIRDFFSYTIVLASRSGEAPSSIYKALRVASWQARRSSSGWAIATRLSDAQGATCTSSVAANNSSTETHIDLATSPSKCLQAKVVHLHASLTSLCHHVHHPLSDRVAPLPLALVASASRTTMAIAEIAISAVAVEVVEAEADGFRWLSRTDRSCEANGYARLNAWKA